MMTKRFILLMQVVLLVNLNYYSQVSTWSDSLDDGRNTFIKNLGQFDGRNWRSDKIEYAVVQNPFYIFFTKTGVTYRFDKSLKIEKKRKRGEGKSKEVRTAELVHATWIGANNNVQIVAEQKTGYYFSYAIEDTVTKKITGINHIKGYKKITYKNLYDNIDVEYIFHPQGGVKYSIILHPGSDPSQIKIKYSSEHTHFNNEEISVELNNAKEIEIKTSVGRILEHRPQTYYTTNQRIVKSKYMFTNNLLSFNLGNYDDSKEIIIDPWIQSPGFNGASAVFEVETDALGNVYTMGGDAPVQLKKYNNTGTLQWTYNTPWTATSSVWIGTMATDNLGTTFITKGKSPAMQKINSAGGLVWTVNNGGIGLSASVEFWSIRLNCDKTRLIVGGMNGGSRGTIYDVDKATGNVIGQTNITPSLAWGVPDEIRGLSSTKYAKYAYLSLHKVGLIDQVIGSCPVPVMLDNNHHYGYKSEDYIPSTQKGAGLQHITANDNFIYTHSGNKIWQRDIQTGALINSVVLPGGGSGIGGSPSGVQMYNCGLDVDSCGNVYAGSASQVVKFDQNLNILGQFAVGFTVYDVDVNSNGEVLAVGAVSNNTVAARNGKIQSISAGACAQYNLVCCDPNFCNVASLCINDLPFNLNPNTLGGSWSSLPVTTGLDTVTGVFNPATAGAGSFTITYTLPCGSNSIVINVGTCTSLIACAEPNGDLTASGGTGPYTWEYWAPATSTPITNQAQCQACGYYWDPGGWFNPAQCKTNSGFFSTVVTSCNTPAGWVSFGGTATTVTPPVGATSIQVTDALGATTVVNLPAASCPTALPINLLYFKGKPIENDNLLEWVTSSEINNDYFTIEHSEDAMEFNVLGKVKGVGNSHNSHSYQLIDNNPKKGINYYRLKQTDFDGIYKYSTIISITNNLSDINIYNTNEFLFIESNKTNITGLLEIFDVTGRILSEIKVNSNTSISLTKYKLGAYIYRFISENGTISDKFLILEHE